MKELLSQIERWSSEDKKVVVATLVRVDGSSPRPLGAKMAISSEGEVSGSVSGGCVESTVADEAKQVLFTGRAKVLSFGISDEAAWTVGLSCGGQIKVFLEALDAGSPVYSALKKSLNSDQPAVRCVVISGEEAGTELLVRANGISVGGPGSAEFQALVQKRAVRQLKLQKTGCQTFTLDDGSEVEVFFEVYPPLEKLVIVGAVHVAIHLVHFARELGFRTIVVDPRSIFATRERFEEADQLLVQWPTEAIQESDLDESTYVAVLSHDERVDNPFLQMALSSRCRYVGALGSKITHARRLRTLRGMGVPEEQLARIHSPIGLDLGGSQPQEIALSIISEIVKVKNK